MADRASTGARLRAWLTEYGGLRDGTDVEGTIAAIRRDVPIHGTSMWMAVCSAMLASLGLDTNSTAVIIGAMLISPLMAPILGIGLAVGIADRALVLQALRSFGLAVLVALLVSTLYFLATPLGETTSEELARITPTLLDVGVAFFGGVAGIVAGSRRDKSTAIPGVAIATALMPPLCTAGYGIATGSPRFFFGAFYLFFINAVFIALATLLVVRWLHFPRVSLADPLARRRLRLTLGALMLAVLGPSLVLLYGVVQEARVRRSLGRFVSREVEQRGLELIRSEVKRVAVGRQVSLVVAGPRLDSARVDSLRARLAAEYVPGATLRLVQIDATAGDADRRRDEVIMGMLEAAAAREPAAAAPAFPSDSLLGRLVAEARAFAPEVSAIAYGRAASADSAAATPALLVALDSATVPRVRQRVADQVTAFLRERIAGDTIAVVVR